MYIIPQVKALTEWINDSVIPTPLILTRRIRGTFASAIQSVATVGTRIKERGFVSCAIDPERMKGWGPVTLIMDVPAGSKGACVKNSGEGGEILLQRDITHWTVMHIDEATKTYIVKVDQEGTI